jgi:putative membrane protein
VSGPPVETQPERTGLAWQRTALGVLAVAGLIAHGAFLDDDLLLVLLSGGLALLGLAVLGLARRRYRRSLRAVAEGAGVSVPRLAALVTGVVAAAAVAACFAVLVHS